jgi:hypothetical protein
MLENTLRSSGTCWEPIRNFMGTHVPNVNNTCLFFFFGVKFSLDGGRGPLCLHSVLCSFCCCLLLLPFGFLLSCKEGNFGHNNWPAASPCFSHTIAWLMSCLDILFYEYRTPLVGSPILFISSTCTILIYAKIS